MPAALGNAGFIRGGLERFAALLADQHSRSKYRYSTRSLRNRRASNPSLSSFNELQSESARGRESSVQWQGMRKQARPMRLRGQRFLLPWGGPLTTCNVV